MVERGEASGLSLNIDIQDITKDDDVHQPNREVADTPIMIKDKKSNTALDSIKKGSVNRRNVGDLSSVKDSYESRLTSESLQRE